MRKAGFLAVTMAAVLAMNGNVLAAETGTEAINIALENEMQQRDFLKTVNGTFQHDEYGEVYSTGTGHRVLHVSMAAKFTDGKQRTLAVTVGDTTKYYVADGVTRSLDFNITLGISCIYSFKGIEGNGNCVLVANFY